MEPIKNRLKMDILPAIVAGIFSADFLDEAYCRNWILTQLHPEGVFCPSCSTEITGKAARSFWQGRKIKCGRCGKFFKPLHGTIYLGCHLDYRGIVLMNLLLGLDLGNSQIARIVGMDAESIRLWRGKLAAATMRSNRRTNGE
jgi:predicted Zn finger-like uncharacterized protein